MSVNIFLHFCFKNKERMNMVCQFLGTKSVAAHASHESFMHEIETTVVNYFIAVKLFLTT